MSVARRQTRAPQRLRAGPSVWPTLGGAAASFALAAHESLIWPQILGCVLLALVATSLAAVALPTAFSVSVEAPARVAAGERFNLAVRIVNRSRFGRRGVVVRHRLRSRRPIVSELVAFVDEIPGGDAVLVRWAPIALRRGGADLADIGIEIAGPFGFFSRHTTHVARASILCLPGPAAPLDVGPSPGYEFGSAAGFAPDADLRGVRDWRPGDQISQVHWRSVVRTGRMTVVERDTRSAGSLVVVVIAPGKLGKAGKPARPVKDDEFEARLSAAAATAAAASRRGVAVCFVARGSHHLEGAGFSHPADEDALLECFARVDVARPPDDALLEHALTHAAHGGVVLVVAATAPAAAASAIAASRAKIAAAAALVGAAVIDVGDLRMRESA